MNLREFLKKEVLILDGAMGTNLSEFGFSGVPELANYEAPELVEQIHRSFIEAGSKAIETNTFGANAAKLKKSGLVDRIKEINEAAVKIAKKAAGSNAFVFGSIGPTGLIPEPLGKVPFDFLYEVFYEQAKLLVEAGVDALILETFIDIQEARIAAMAACKASNLPVFVTLTFNSELRTELSASSPEACMGILESIEGVCGVGSNCGLGPEQFVEIASRMGSVAEKNTIFQPNAGIPEVKNGKTVFSASPTEYRDFAEKAYESGAAIIGGCCGSKPEHIKAIAEAIAGKKPISLRKRSYFYLCTPRDFFAFDLNARDFLVVGERINPAGRKDLQEDMKSRKFELVLKEAKEQEKHGANVLDVNASIALEDEKELLSQLVKKLSYQINIPLSIDTTSKEALIEALKVYPGRAIINSIPAKESDIEESLDIARRFGQSFIGLALTDRGVPKTAEEKVNAIEFIWKKAEEKGFSKSHILFDPVVLSAATASVKETLKAVEELRNKDFYTVFGLSNVSHGLPSRKIYNRAFGALAASKGLSGAIIDPLDRELLNTIKASRFLMKITTELIIDEELRAGIEERHFKAEENKNQNSLYIAIVEGDKERARNLAEEALGAFEPYEVVSRFITPAMEEVGALFQQKKIFLPSVLLSAEAVKEAFEVIKPELLKSGKAASKGKVILATVQGDVHDIGKGIVGTVLFANGWEVIDLGVDVAPEVIVERINEANPEIIGLSCLMTTTLPSLEKTVRMIKEKYPDKIVAIGGAVVTERVKEAYGADIYAKDAMEFAKILNERFRI